MSEQNNENSQFRRAFENKEDFMKYYNEHKEEIDKLTTKQLNSVYKIESCKITRNKNKIVIRNISSKDKDVKEVENKDQQDKDAKQKTKQNKQFKPKDLIKSIDLLINHYEKQLTTLKEMKDKIVSDNLYDSDHNE